MQNQEEALDAPHPANAKWMVSENHGNDPALFREPLPCTKEHSSTRKRFRHHMFIANSGYRTRYLLVAADTSVR